MSTTARRGAPRAGAAPWVELVGDTRLPRRIAGHPALELCNTLPDCRVPRGDQDYLTDFETLCLWAERDALLEPALLAAARDAAAADPAAARLAVEHVREFRVALWRTLVAPTPEDQLVVTARAEEAAGHLLLELGPPARFTFADDLGTRLPLLATAWSAAGLLASPDRAHVRRCAGRDCGWLFLDTSGRRRWCVMAGCGNRAKARRFAERARSSG